MKLLERCIIALVLMFAFINVVVFFVLNSKTVQHTIVDYINSQYLSQQNLKLDIGSLSLSFFNGNLNLNEVYIREKSSNNAASKGFGLGLNQISISFNIAASYVKWRPVVKKVLLRGVNANVSYDAQNKLILPAFLQSKDGNKPLDIPAFLKKNLYKFPKEIEVLNSTIVLGNPNIKNYQLISVSQFNVKKMPDLSRMHGIEINALAADSVFLFPTHPEAITVPYTKIRFILSENGDFSLPQFAIKSSLVDVGTQAQGRINSKIENSFYTANIDQLVLHAGPFFQLLDMKSKGEAKISGDLTSGRTIFDHPTFFGKIEWQDFVLNKFDIYSGHADFSYNKKKIIYENADIRTNHNGRLLAKGEFQLYEKYYFENKVQIQSFSFAELLNGLDVPGSPVDFDINAPETTVSGYIKSPDSKKNFELNIQTAGQISKFLVTSFQDQKQRAPIPGMKFKTSLLVNTQGISFVDSFVSLKEKSGKIYLEKGELDFRSPKSTGAYFKFKGNDVDLAAAEYFLRMPAAGLANLTGEIKTSPTAKGVLFSSIAQAKEGEIFGVKFKNMSAKWGIDSDKIWVQNGDVLVAGKDVNRSATIIIPRFSLDFANSYAQISALINGNLNGLMSGIQHWVPANVFNPDSQEGESSSISGNIQRLVIDINGPLFHPSRWDLQAQTKIEKINTTNAFINFANVSLNCVKGICARSSVILNDIKYINITEEDKNITPISVANNSFVFLKISKLSFDDSLFSARIKNLPLGIFNNLVSHNLKGTLSVDAELSGQWGNLSGFVDSYVYNFKFDDLNIGDLGFTIRPTDNNKFKFDLRAFQNQVLISLLTSLRSNGSPSINIDLIDFDPTLLFSNQTRMKQNLYSKLTGHVSLQGPDFDHMSGKGIFQSADIQFGKIIFSLAQPIELSINKNQLAISPFRLNELSDPELQIKVTKTLVDFSKKLLATSISVDSDLQELNQFSSIFEPSDGRLSAHFILHGTFSQPDISGKISLYAKTLNLKNYTPPFENVSGNFVLDNNILKIISFKATKGKGNIDISGFVNSLTKSPEFSLHLVANNIDTRIPVPIFLIADSTLSADLSLTGNTAPYLLSGDINVNKFSLFRDINCNDMIREIISANNTAQSVTDNANFLNLNLNIIAQSSISIQSQCLRGRFSTAPRLTVKGDSTSPTLLGGISTDFGTLLVFKTLFTMRQADFNFIEFQKYDPNVNIRMDANVSSYNLSMNINGQLTVARVDLSIDPPTLTNGTIMTQADILSVISTGHIPMQSSSANLLAASSSTFSIFGVQNIFEDTLNNQLSNITGGFIDNVSLTPTTQYGQLGGRLSVSKSLTSRLELGMSYETGGYGSDRSAYATFMFNDTVNAISSIDDPSILEQQQQIGPEFYSGLRFRFGSP